MQGEVAGLGAPPWHWTWSLPGFPLEPSGDAWLSFIFLTPPLLQWTSPVCGSLLERLQGKLEKEKKFPYQPCVVSKHWSLPPRLQEPAPSSLAGWTAAAWSSSSAVTEEPAAPKGRYGSCRKVSVPQREQLPRGNKSYLMEGPLLVCDVTVMKEPSACLMRSP